jgi:TRAP-type C4-dicarboxylate transport system permease large subunit
VTRHDGYRPAERGRRIRWRAVSIGTFLVLVGAAYGIAFRMGWPTRGEAAVVGLPYWALVTAIWRRKGPYMPALHGNYDRR